MSIDFDWEISEEDEPQLNAPPPQKKWLGWVAPLISLVLLASAGVFLYTRLNSSDRQLKQTVQGILDLEQSAFRAGDGELFFSFFEDDDAFRFAQLLPENQAFHSAEQTVSNVEQHENILWANITYESASGPAQRLNFFEQSPTGVTQIATDAQFWGSFIDSSYDWGALRLYEADSVWEDQFATNIELAIEAEALEDSLSALQSSFAIIIRDDFKPSTLENVLHYPSPRLLGLNDEGQPNEQYWQGLSELITSHLSPITIRFAIPPGVKNDLKLIDLFQMYANAFEEQYPANRVNVEIIAAEQLSQDPAEWLPTVDAAFYRPSEALIKSGAVYDLTSFATGDSRFDTGDFYDQAWRGGWWRDRMWMVPWSTSINLLYYDINQFNDNNIPQPTEQWSWELLSETVAQFDEPAFIDGSRDALFAYALSEDRGCTTADCMPQLTRQGVQAALNWYVQSVVDTQTAHPLTSLPDEERRQFIQDSLSVKKRAAVWVDSPLRFEYQSQLQRTHVVPLPSVSAENGTPVTPVHINGYIMSQSTKSPFWTWQWLKFMSYQPSLPAFRDIPARPSATRQSSYWEWLRPPIGDAMRSATSNTRPILIGDERYFTWQQLDNAVSGAMSIEDSAEPLSSPWFAQPQQ